MNIYETLAAGIGDLPLEDSDSNGVDAFLSTDRVKTAGFDFPDMFTVTSMDDLVGFSRIGNNTLVHKAQKDLWRISENKGEVVIERLFDPSTNAALKV